MFAGGGDKYIVGKKQKKPKLPDRQGLTIAERVKRAYEAYAGAHKECPMMARIAIAAEAGITSTANIFRWKKRYNWDSQVLAEAEAKKIAEAQIKAVLTQEDVKEGDTKSSVVVGDIKRAAHQAVKIHETIVSNAALLIDFYAKQIKTLVDERGGMDGLTESDRQQLETWTSRLNKHKDEIKEFIRPHQVAAYLRVAGLDHSGDVDIDKSAFTPERIQALISEVYGIQPTAIGDTVAVEKVFAEHDTAEHPLPAIKGTR